MLLLGVWWTRLTARGAVAGMVVGAVSCGAALLAGAALRDAGGWAVLFTQPAAWTIPLTTAVIVLVSLADRGGVPLRVDRYLARLHTPDV